MDKKSQIVLVIGIAITILLLLINIYLAGIVFILVITLFMLLHIMQEHLSLPDVEAGLTEDARSIILKNSGNSTAFHIHVALVPMNTEYDVPCLAVDESHTYPLASMIQEVKVVVTFENEKEAKVAAKQFLERNATRRYIAKSVSKDDSDIIELNLILKSDVAGSLEAVKKMLSEIKNPGLKIKIVSDGVGAVSESDAAMAVATKAIILAFRVAISLPAKKIIDKEKISAFEYQVIYELVDDVKKILLELLPPIRAEIETGRGEILAEFRNDKKGVVVGFRVDDGEFKSGNMVKILSEKVEIWRGKIESLRREKDEVSTVSAGTQAGIALAAGAQYGVGDKLVAFKLQETKQTL